MSEGKAKLRQADCYSCPKHLQYNEPMPVKQKGVVMHMGERFCLANRRARRFQRSDPKLKVPAWCPRRKSPCELRVYRFKDISSWMIHEDVCQALNQEVSPEGYRYAVAFDLKTELSARDFWDRCDVDLTSDLLGVAVGLHHVVEIDDGLQPAYFYKTMNGYRYEPFFDAARARENKLNDDEEDE